MSAKNTIVTDGKSQSMTDNIGDSNLDRPKCPYSIDTNPKPK